jgi:L,D-transpeptidase catalytic domain
VPTYERTAIPRQSYEPDKHYNMTTIMSASVTTRSRGSTVAWRPPRLSGRAMLIAVLAMGLALSSRGANAIAQPGVGPVVGGSARATETAALQAEASRLTAQYRADPQALRQTALAALTAGRNDATVAVFLRLRWAGRLSAELERYGAMLPADDLPHLTLAAAGVQHYGVQLHNGLLQDGPSPLITVSVQGQRLIAYDRGRVVVDAPVTTGRPALPTDIGAMHVLRKDAPWTMQSPWPKGTPEWYPDTVVQKVLWFTKNGEGLHDASWQPVSTLGPGSQYGPFASHGCIHVPLAAVTTLFDWAPVGTPVVVYPGDGSPVASQALQQSVDASGDPISGVRGA